MPISLSIYEHRYMYVLCLSVDVRISGFVLVLHLPYLLRIQHFFMDNLPKQPEEPQQQKTKEIAKPKVGCTSRTCNMKVGSILELYLYSCMCLASQHIISHMKECSLVTLVCMDRQRGQLCA